MPKGTDYKGKKRIMRALKINEISGVDVPAQEGARAVLMKRHEEDTVDKGMAITTEDEGHTHLVMAVGPGGTELPGGETLYDQTGHAHPWVRTGDMSIVFGAAHSEGEEPHTHELAQVSTKGENTELEDIQDSDEEDTSASLQTSKADITNPEAAGGSAGVVGPEGVNMTDMIEKAAHDTAVTALQAKLDRSESIAKMNDAEKTHFNGLTADKQDAFLAKSAGDRSAEVDAFAKAALDNDPVEYTTTDGIELRKSAGLALISMAKSNDVLIAKNAKLETAMVDASYTKRAETELENLPGDVNTRVAMLKAVDGIEDETQRALALTALKAHNEAMSGAFVSAGHGGGPVASEGSPEAELDALAKKHAADNGCDFSKAYTAVLDTPKGAELYAKSVG